MDEAGISRDAVRNAITPELSKKAKEHPFGSQKNSGMIGGQEIEYRTFKFSDGSLNVGSIFFKEKK